MLNGSSGCRCDRQRHSYGDRHGLPDDSRLRQVRLTSTCRRYGPFCPHPPMHQTAHCWHHAQPCNDKDEAERRVDALAWATTACATVIVLNQTGTLWICRRNWRTVVCTSRVVAAVVAIVVTTCLPPHVSGVSIARAIAALIAAVDIVKRVVLGSKVSTPMTEISRKT